MSEANSRSPWRTWISTCGWLSDAVEKTCDLLVGIVVFRSMSRVMTPPSVSIPSDSGRDVEEEDVLHLAAEDARLDRRADRDDLVRVDAPVRLLAAEHPLDRLDDRRHPGHPADENDLVDVGGREAGVLDRLLDRAGRLLDQVADELLELGAGERHDEVLRVRSASAVM